ncbi:MAG: hypothetical protein K9M10_03950 [Candidatus Pacebacteria bacterium]|nr:hypothetical protein [Candidatus Paceibacterota bacterium]MCF7857601.1 hypothetical protein [Candidatus Paceibacterota bacterium]
MFEFHKEISSEEIKELDDLVKSISELLGEDFTIEIIDGTYQIDGNRLTLTFTIDEGMFEIRSIDTHGNSGTGSEIVDVIHEYADEHELSVMASNVVDSARGFWEGMGYQEGSNDDEFFRPE